jgi:hypothetical protein
MGNLPRWHPLGRSQDARNLDDKFTLSNRSLKITHAAFVTSVVESKNTVKDCFSICFNPDQHLDFLALAAINADTNKKEKGEILNVTTNYAVCLMT